MQEELCDYKAIKSYENALESADSQPKLLKEETKDQAGTGNDQTFEL